MDKNISFSVEKIEFIEEVKKSRFTKVKIWCFASGKNLHDMPVTEELLKKRADTIYDIPLVWELAKNDAGNHSPKENPCGFVHRQNNEIKFEYADDGRLFLIIEALIWKNYSGSLLSFFKRDNDVKPVSVELQVLEKKVNEFGKDEILDYCFQCITILGTYVTPAIPLAKAEILEFSKAKKEVEKILSKEKSYIRNLIDNNKTLEQSDLNFSSQEEEIKNKNLPKEVKIVDKFNKEEFAQKFSMTANDIWRLLGDAVEKVKYGENEYCKYWISDHDESYIYVYDNEDGGKKAIPYTIEGDNVTCNFENAKVAKLVSNWIIDEDGNSSDEDDMAIKLAKTMMAKDKPAEEEPKEETEEFTKLKEEFDAMSLKCADLETKYSTLQTDFAILEQFKSNTEAEAEQLKMSNLVEEYAKALSEEEKKEFSDKIPTITYAELKNELSEKVAKKALFAINNAKPEITDNVDGININFSAFVAPNVEKTEGYTLAEQLEKKYINQ